MRNVTLDEAGKRESKIPEEEEWFESFGPKSSEVNEEDEPTCFLLLPSILQYQISNPKNEKNPDFVFSRNKQSEEKEEEKNAETRERVNKTVVGSVHL